MASILFDADLDTKKLDEAIEKSNQKVDDWVKNLIKSVDAIDERLSKVGANVNIKPITVSVNPVIPKDAEEKIKADTKDLLELDETVTITPTYDNSEVKDGVKETKDNLLELEKDVPIVKPTMDTQAIMSALANIKEMAQFSFYEINKLNIPKLDKAPMLAQLRDIESEAKRMMNEMFSGLSTEEAQKKIQEFKAKVNDVLNKVVQIPVEVDTLAAKNRLTELRDWLDAKAGAFVIPIETDKSQLEKDVAEIEQAKEKASEEVKIPVKVGDKEEIRGQIEGLVYTIKDSILEIPEIGLKMDVSGLKGQTQEAIDELLGMVLKVEDEYENLAMIPGKISNETKKAINDQATYVENLGQKIQGLQQILDSIAVDDKTREGFEKSLKELDARLTEATEKLLNMKKKVVETNGEEAKSDDLLGKAKEMLSGKLGKYLKLTSAIAIAQQIFMGAVNQSRNAQEKFEVATSMARGALEGFFETIRTGDLGHFIENMAEGVKSAKAFTEEMQRYGKIKESQAANDMILAANQEKLMVDMRSQSKTFDERIEAYNAYVKAAREDAQQEIDVEKEHLTELIRIAGQRKKLANERLTDRFGGITEERAKLFVTLPESSEKDIEVFMKAYEKLRLKIDEGINPSGQGIDEFVANLREELKNSIPEGQNFNDMMMVAAMRTELQGKKIDSLKGGVMELIKKESDLKTVLTGVSRIGNSLGLDLQIGSLGKLTQQLKDLEMQLDRTADPVMQHAYQAQINNKKREIDEATSIITGKRTEAQVIRDEINSLKIEARSIDQLGSKKTLEESKRDTEKELLELEQKYKEEIAMAVGNEGKLKLLEQRHELQTAIIRKKGREAEREYLAEGITIDREQKDKLIDTQLQFEQTLLDVQKDSANKARAQAELDYKKRIVDLDRQKRDLIKEQNIRSGGLVMGDSGMVETKIYNKELTGEAKEVDVQARIDAEKVLVGAILKIDREAAEERKQINREANDAFLSDMTRVIQGIHDKYEELRKAMEANGATAQDKIELSLNKERELANAYLNDKLNQLDIDRDVSMQRAELDLRNANHQIRLRKLDYANFVETTKKKIDLLVKMGDVESLRQSRRLMTDLELAAEQDILDTEKERLEVQGLIAGVLGDIISQLGEQLGLTAEAMDFLNQGLGAVKQLASGDWIGAAITTLHMLISLIPSEEAKFKKQIDAINDALKEQQRLIEKSNREGGQVDALKEELELLKKLEAAYKKEYERLKQKADNHLDLLGWRHKKAKEAYDDWQEVTDQIEDANEALSDVLSGGITQNTIADAITRGFSEGKRSVKDFAEYMNDVLRDAVLNVFSMKILGPAVDELTAYAALALEDLELSPEEVKNIQDMMGKIVESQSQLWDNLNSAIPKPAEETGGRLSGAIQRQITEDTGTELAGLMRKISDDNRHNVDYNKQSVSHLVMIEANTYQTVEELKLAVVELKGINYNTKPEFSGI